MTLLTVVDMNIRPIVLAFANDASLTSSKSSHRHQWDYAVMGILVTCCHQLSGR